MAVNSSLVPMWSECFSGGANEAISRPHKRKATWAGWPVRLVEQNQAVFLLEQLQPSWLQFDHCRWIYALTTRVMVSIFIAFGFIIGFLELALEEFSLLGVSASLITSLLLGIVLGSVDAFHFTRQLTTEQETGGRNDGWIILARLVAVGLLTLLVTNIIFLAFGFEAEYTGGIAFIHAFIYALVFGVRGRRRSVSGDIRPVETVIWSWSGALFGTVPGLVIGAVLGVLDQYVTSDIQQNSVILFFAIMVGMFTGLVSGLRRGAVVSQDRPNNGLVLSLRNGMRVGLVFAFVTAVAFIVIFSLDPVNAEYRWEALQFALRMGFVLGSYALLWFGGMEVLHHVVLRTLLRFEGNTPPHYTDFSRLCCRSHLSTPGWWWIHFRSSAPT